MCPVARRSKNKKLDGSGLMLRQIMCNSQKFGESLLGFCVMVLTEILCKTTDFNTENYKSNY